MAASRSPVKTIVPPEQNFLNSTRRAWRSLAASRAARADCSVATKRLVSIVEVYVMAQAVQAARAGYGEIAEIGEPKDWFKHPSMHGR